MTSNITNTNDCRHKLTQAKTDAAITHCAEAILDALSPQGAYVATARTDSANIKFTNPVGLGTLRISDETINDPKWAPRWNLLLEGAEAVKTERKTYWYSYGYDYQDGVENLLSHMRSYADSVKRNAANKERNLSDILAKPAEIDTSTMPEEEVPSLDCYLDEMNAE